MKTVFSLLASLLLGTAASAATTGFSLGIAGDNNIPTLTLTNTGDLGEIIGFDVTMGVSGYNFDGVTNSSEAASAGVSTTLTVGDYNTSGGSTSAGRYTTISYTSTGFTSGGSFSYAVDVDSNYANNIQNYQTRMLPGGSFSVYFSGGLTSSLTIDLTPTAGNMSEPYFYSASVTDAAPVPLPAGLPLLIAALGGAVALTRKRRAAA
ncbi:VPLPA-CTERM sorting domain-containing protein [Primorskyibacter sp. 2E107]|uniref:VPLPA-CTERM sorting domain-containing protein n=1 Tax=Primorskyibacter sp. 2E107 TaxID=3403458 RepID=UPI003AF67EDB